MFPKRLDILVPRTLKNAPCIQSRGEFRLARKGATLGNFVFVVRKDQVDPAGMDIEHRGAGAAPDQFQRHGRALEMPSRSASPERRIPCRAGALVLRLGRLPEYEVPRIFLVVLVSGHPPPRPALQFALVQL